MEKELEKMKIRILHRFKHYGSLTYDEIEEWYTRVHPKLPSIEGVFASWKRKTLPGLPKMKELSVVKALESLVNEKYLEYLGLTSFTDRVLVSHQRKAYRLTDLGKAYKDRTEHR